MKYFLSILLLILLISCESSGRKLLYERKEYWSKKDGLPSEKLRQKYYTYLLSEDTMIYITNYYESGRYKSKVVMKNDVLYEIKDVVDTLGRKLDFGHFKNGDGYVVEFNSYDGKPDREGPYKNGNREGWWKTYHFSGVIQDSTLYKGGFPQLEKTNNSLETLLDIMGPMKNNLYE